MSNILSNFLIPANFKPLQANFMSESSNLMYFTVYSNILTAILYVLVPFFLFYVFRKRIDLAFSKVTLLFGIIILNCSLLHIINVIVFWYPIFYIQAFFTTTAAVSSVIAFFTIIIKMPIILKYTVPKQIENISNKLLQEIQSYKKLEEELIKSNSEIDKSNYDINEKNIQLEMANRFMTGRDAKIHELESLLQKLKQEKYGNSI